MRLIGYIRVSTDEQARNGHSMAVQDKALHTYCELYEHDLVDVIVDDGVSAGTELAKRPGGAMLMDRLRNGEADGVVFTDLDRMFRLTVDGLLTAQWFERRDLRIHAVNEHIDTTDPDGWFVLTLKLAVSERERRKTSQRNTRVAAGLKAAGKAYGHTPYGCIRRGGALYQDPNTWPIRQRIVDRKAAGESYKQLAKTLNQDGVPAPFAGKTRKVNNRKTTLTGRLWHVSTLLGIVKNHHELEHIPPLPEAPETPVSDGGDQ